MDVNSGYSGFSMSKRAVEAYESGEKPKSKWTKGAMLLEIDSYLEDSCTTLEDEAISYLEGLTRAEMFDRFFIYSSWHHTSKHFNATDFYSLDEDELDEYAANPTRRVYSVEYHLGNHGKDCGRKFATRAQAERFVESKGFKRMLYSYFKGNFTAQISFRKEKIA